MGIDQITLYKAKAPRKFPFRTSKAVQHSVDGVFVEVMIGDATGTGEVAPRPHINGETLDGAYEQMQLIAKLIMGKYPEQAVDILHTSETGPSARLGMEMAIYDAFTQNGGRAICDYFGNSGRSSVSYCGFMSSDESNEKLVKKATTFKDKGYEIVRAKVGELPFEDDLKRVTQLRAIFGAEVKIWLDVNQAWSTDDAADFAAQLEHLDIMMLEQPLPEDDYAGHAALRKATSIPIMIDEGVQTAADLDQVIALEAADAVNLKTLKLGGFDETRKVVQRAEEAEIDAYCGGTAVTDIFAAYARHIEFALPGLKYFSAGAPRSASFKKNPTFPKLKYQPSEPRAARPSQSGLGVKLGKANFPKFVEEQWQMR